MGIMELWGLIIVMYALSKSEINRKSWDEEFWDEFDQKN